MRKPRVNFTLTRRCKLLLEKLAIREGMSQSAYLEMLVRQEATRLKVTVTAEEIESMGGDEEERE